MPPLALTAAERTALESLARARAAEARVVERARVVLERAEGVPLTGIARSVGIDRKTVRRTLRRYVAQRDQRNPSVKHV